MDKAAAVPGHEVGEAGAMSAEKVIAPHRTAPHHTAPHRTASHRTAPHRIAPYRTAPHGICIHCVVVLITSASYSRAYQGHDYTIQFFIKPDVNNFLPYPPVLISKNKTMNALKLKYKEGPGSKPKKLADLKIEKGDDWCVFTNEHGGADDVEFELCCNYIIDKEGELGVGKGMATGFLQLDHHGTRDNARAQKKLRDNNFRMLGPPSHASHWAAALDCGFNAFALLEMGNMAAGWYAEANPGQQMNDADVMGILVLFYYRCTEGDLKDRARAIVIKSFSDVGILDGRRESMVAFDKVNGVGSQFSNPECSISEQERRTRQSQRCKGVTKTDTREADGQIINIYTDQNTQSGAIRAAVHKGIFDNEIKPRTEYSKLEKMEKEAKKQKLPPAKIKDNSADDDSDDDEEELNRRQALDSRGGYFYSEDYQRYLDKYEEKKESEVVLSAWKGFVKRVLVYNRARHEFAAVQLRIMKDKFEEAESGGTEDTDDGTKKKCLKLRRARLALQKEDTTLQPLKAAFMAVLSVRADLNREKEARAVAAVEKENKRREREEAKASKAASKMARRASNASARALKPAPAQPKRDASASPEKKPKPKRPSLAPRPTAKPALPKSVRASKSKAATKGQAATARKAGPQKRRAEAEEAEGAVFTKTTTRFGRHAGRMRL